MLFDIIRFIVGIIVLLYAMYADIKTRRVNNIPWIVMGTTGMILLITQFLTIGIDDILYLVFVPVMIVFIYILFKIGLLPGGADAKAFMALTILIPLKPSFFIFPIWTESMMPFPSILFFNTFLLFIPMMLFLLFYNKVKKRDFNYFIKEYKMPFMIPIFTSFLVSFFFGDILSYLMHILK